MVMCWHVTTELYIYIYIYKLKDNCLQFDINSFKYSDYNPCDFENDIDPDTNFYNILTSKCEYYTDSKFTEKISKINGLSFIHFNARSLNKNFLKSKDYNRAQSTI